MAVGSAWTYLFVAGVLEIIWAVSLNSTQGFTKLLPSVLVLVVMGFSVFCLSQAVKGLPVGTAYAIWTGIGASGTVIFGMLFFGEAVQFLRIFCIFLIIAGTVGLRFFN